MLSCHINVAGNTARVKSVITLTADKISRKTSTQNDRLTPLKIGVILLDSRVPTTITFDFMIPQSLNRSALHRDNYGSNSVDGELKGHKRIKESSPRDELLNNLDQEQGEGYTSKTGAHHVERLLEVVVLKCLNASGWFKRRQVSSKTPGNCNANESHIDHSTDLGKGLGLF